MGWAIGIIIAIIIVFSYVIIFSLCYEAGENSRCEEQKDREKMAVNRNDV